ncbi:phage holin family protein [Arenivirga flava]|uniref:Membrane protein n=1 Tax=Arenivirga flava TaxID=1930060 RepID=A0AA37XDF1_9MICO|nr:phage holin family protein [Arenivirga flava]GMA29537.1 membrane protein [Arenivirga flava]
MSERRGLLDLAGRVTDLVTRLIRDEIRAAKLEMARKLKAAGTGLGLLAGAAVLGFFALGVLVAAAVAGLAGTVPGWLAALVVAGALLLAIAALALLGVRAVKRGVPPVPRDTIDSVRADVRTITGSGS